MKIALIYTPHQIHSDVLNWLTDGWKGGRPEEAIPFLKHLAALRQATGTKAEAVIVIEQGTILAPGFDNTVTALIPKIPLEYTTCLLTHYVSDWKGVTYVPGSDNLLCHPTENIHGSFAYWMRMSHVEHLLAMYDQPLRNIANFKLTPEKISRYGRLCMVVKPLAARQEEQRYRDYYNNYGFTLDS